MNGTTRPLPAPQEILDFTRQILRRPEFHRPDETADRSRSLIERFLSWLGSLDMPRIGPIDTTPIEVALTLLLAGVLAYLAWRLLSRAGGLRRLLKEAGSRRRKRRAAEASEGSGTAGGPEGASGGASGEGAGASLQRAEEALARGDARSAIRVLYTHAVDWLAGGSFLHKERWKTSLAYLEECPRESKHYRLLEAIVRAYNAVVYGHRTYDERELARLLGELRLRSQGR